MKAVFTFCYFWAVLIDGLSNVESRTVESLWTIDYLTFDL